MDVAGGWYHVTNRGHRRGALLLEDAARRRFMGAVAGLPERYGMEYAQRLMSGQNVNEEEQTSARRMRRRSEWAEWVQAAEQERGEGWERWAERHGDWGRASKSAETPGGAVQPRSLSGNERLRADLGSALPLDSATAS